MGVGVFGDRITRWVMESVSVSGPSGFCDIVNIFSAISAGCVEM